MGENVDGSTPLPLLSSMHIRSYNHYTVDCDTVVGLRWGCDTRQWHGENDAQPQDRLDQLVVLRRIARCSIIEVFLSIYWYLIYQELQCATAYQMQLLCKLESLGKIVDKILEDPEGGSQLVTTLNIRQFEEGSLKLVQRIS